MLDRSSGECASELHLVSGGADVPPAACVIARQAGESTWFEGLMQDVRSTRRQRWQCKAAGEKSYSHPLLRRWFARRGVDAVMSRRSNQVVCDSDLGLDRLDYLHTSAVERCVRRLKERQRVGTHSDKVAGSVMAVVSLAFIQRNPGPFDPS